MTLQEILKKYFKEESLTEAAQTELTTLFESAVKEAVDAKLAEAVADKEKTLEEEVKEDLRKFKEDLVVKMNGYLEMVVDEFVEANKADQISEIKVKMADAIIEKITGVVKENFVEISEETVDAVKELETANQSMKDQLDIAVNENVELKAQTLEYQKAVKFAAMTEDLSDNQRAKLLSLVEDIDANSIETFEKKVSIIMNSITESGTRADDDAKDLENLDESITDPATPGDDPLKKYLPGNCRL